MSDTLTKVEQELRRRALEQFTRELDSAIASLRGVVSANAGELFHRIPENIDSDIRALRTKILDQLGTKVGDEAVRKGSEIMFKLMGE